MLIAYVPQKIVQHMRDAKHVHKIRAREVATHLVEGGGTVLQVETKGQWCSDRLLVGVAC